MTSPFICERPFVEVTSCSSSISRRRPSPLLWGRPFVEASSGDAGDGRGLDSTGRIVAAAPGAALR